MVFLLSTVTADTELSCCSVGFVIPNVEIKHLLALGSCDRASWAKCEEIEKKTPTRCNNQMFIINFCHNIFRASLCPSSGEERPCVTVYGVLRWFCWMWLVTVVGRCVVGCSPQLYPLRIFACAIWTCHKISRQTATFFQNNFYLY
jgi:hypothetical protein